MNSTFSSNFSRLLEGLLALKSSPIGSSVMDFSVDTNNGNLNLLLNLPISDNHSVNCRILTLLNDLLSAAAFSRHSFGQLYHSGANVVGLAYPGISPFMYYSPSANTNTLRNSSNINVSGQSNAQSLISNNSSAFYVDSCYPLSATRNHQQQNTYSSLKQPISGRQINTYDGGNNSSSIASKNIIHSNIKSDTSSPISQLIQGDFLNSLHRGNDNNSSSCNGNNSNGKNPKDNSGIYNESSPSESCMSKQASGPILSSNFGVDRFSSLLPVLNSQIEAGHNFGIDFNKLQRSFLNNNTNLDSPSENTNGNVNTSNNIGNGININNQFANSASVNQSDITPRSFNSNSVNMIGNNGSDKCPATNENNQDWICDCNKNDYSLSTSPSNLNTKLSLSKFNDGSNNDNDSNNNSNKAEDNNDEIFPMFKKQIAQTMIIKLASEVVNIFQKDPLTNNVRRIIASPVSQYLLSSGSIKLQTSDLTFLDNIKHDGTHRYFMNSLCKCISALATQFSDPEHVENLPNFYPDPQQTTLCKLIFRECIKVMDSYDLATDSFQYKASKLIPVNLKISVPNNLDPSSKKKSKQLGRNYISGTRLFTVFFKCAIKPDEAVRAIAYIFNKMLEYSTLCVSRGSGIYTKEEETLLSNALLFLLKMPVTLDQLQTKI